VFFQASHAVLSDLQGVVARADIEAVEDVVGRADLGAGPTPVLLHCVLSCQKLIKIGSRLPEVVLQRVAVTMEKTEGLPLGLVPAVWPR